MPFTPKNYLSEMVWYFIRVHIMNGTLHGRLEIQISLRVIFSTQEEKFRISVQPCNILCVLFCHLVWKHHGILTCFKLMSPERIKKYGYISLK